MKHTISKFLSNRGSALFMVLSTMTALMISCMAMYFSVISSRSTQYAIFNQQQSYQSAVSLSDALIASMITNSGGMQDLSSKIWTMDVGDSISTNSNGFATFDTIGAGKEDDDQVGAYMLNATRLDDETLADGTVVRLYDIVITSSVNGSKEVYHNIIQMTKPQEDTITPGPSNVFTATGYVPNDVFLDGGNITTDVFFDNEHTIVNAYGGKSMTLDGNLSTGGSLTINKWLEIKANRKLTFAIRDTYTSHANQVIKFYKPTGSNETERNKNKSVVMVGGDCFMYNGAKFQNANVYILGNLHVRGNTFDSSCNYYVDGDIILDGGYWHSLDNVYCNGTVDTSKNSGGGINAALAGKWTGNAKGKEKDGIMTVSEMISLLDEKTSSSTYYKWIVDTKDFKKKTIHFDTSNDNASPTYLLSYSDTEKGCIIEDLTVNNPNNSGGWKTNCTLVIDTGENPENVYTIQVMANRDYVDSKPGKDTFCWFPRNTVNGSDTWSGNSNMTFQILVVGRGSVVVDIPAGVTYQDDDYMKFMHYGWFALNGGTEYYYGEPEQKSNRAYRLSHTAYIRKGDSSDDAAFFGQFIHRGCHDGDGCSYTEKETKNVCPACGKKYVNVICLVHEKVDTYCPECQPNRASHENVCNNRVGRSEIDAYLASHADIKKMMTGDDGKIVYPNVNIFLVSCDENADIRLSSRAASKAEGSTSTFIQNSFFGYVYAPYLTFKAGPSNSGGGMVRLLGGLTVSDYIIDDSYSLLSCWPDKIPEELMSAESLNTPLGGVASKNWKISLKAH